MGPSKGIDSLGSRLKPSSVLMTLISSQSEGRSTQLGRGRLTLRPVLWLLSITVNQSLGNGPPVRVSRLKRACTLAGKAGADEIRVTMKDKIHLSFIMFYPSLSPIICSAVN